MAGPGLLQHPGARRRRGPGGQHVVHEEDAPGQAGPSRAEGTGQGPPPLRARKPSLGPGVSDPLQHRPDGQVEPIRHPTGQHLSLVEASPAQPPARQRHPGHGLRPEVVPRFDHGTGQVAPQGVPARELHPVDGPADRAVVQERSPGRVDLPGRTIAAPGHGGFQRPAAPPAPRRGDDCHLAGAPAAQRPRPGATSGAAAGEQEVDDRGHPGTVAGAGDTSSAGPAPRTACPSNPDPCDRARTPVAPPSWARGGRSWSGFRFRGPGPTPAPGDGASPPGP
jgi:hypothetical protein